MKNTEILAKEIRAIATSLANKNYRKKLLQASDRLEDLETIARFYRIEAEKNLKRWHAAQECIWIPVDEQLPNKCGTYLVVGKSGTVCTARFYEEITINGKVYPAHFSNRYTKVWANLPEPPKTNSEAESKK